MDSDLMTGFLAGQADSNNNRNDGMGWSGEWFWIIIILAMFWGNGNFGNGNNAGLQGALTRADLCQDMNFGQVQDGVRGIQQGLCDGFYAMNTSLLNGFNGVDNAICSIGYQTQQGINSVNNTLMQGFSAANVVALQNQNAIQTQLADCCCTTNRNIERGFADANYNLATQSCAIQTAMANNTRDIIDSQQAGTRAILDYLCQEKISDLQNENQSLRLAASQQAQNAYLVNTLRPMPQPSYITCNPFTGTYGGYAGYGNAYNGGCNSGCCGCNG